MITADSVFDLILRITERFEDENDYCIRRWMTKEVEGEEIDFVLDGEIKTALDCLNIKNQVRAISVCDHTYVICVSFVVGDELYQRIIVAEECGEPLYEDDWKRHNWETCPICGFEFMEG